MNPLIPLVKFLVSHSLISKETVRVLIGWFLYIPAAIVPIVIVSVLLFASRKMTARGVSQMNLIIASGAVLFLIMATSGCRWAGSPPPRPHPFTVREFFADLVVFCWFVGAVRLFYRKRLAWIGSVIGTGASVAFFASILIGFVTEYLYPDAEMIRVKEFGNGGYVFALVVGLTGFSIPLAICWRLLLGLFQMRKEIFTAS